MYHSASAGSSSLPCTPRNAVSPLLLRCYEKAPGSDEPFEDLPGRGIVTSNTRQRDASHGGFPPDPPSCSQARSRVDSLPDSRRTPMESFLALFQACLTIALVLLAMTAAYMVHRMIVGLRVYCRYRAPLSVTCPATHHTARVELAARSLGMRSISGEPSLRLSACSNWPAREGCAQSCLREIEARGARVRPSALNSPCNGEM